MGASVPAPTPLPTRRAPPRPTNRLTKGVRGVADENPGADAQREGHAYQRGQGLLSYAGDRDQCDGDRQNLRLAHTNQSGVFDSAGAVAMSGLLATHHMNI
jgi:hypothetical protein